jgi:transcriptional regulator GlxA family with amidase domain
LSSASSNNGRLQVGILIFEDVEVLDFCGPYEVFSVTNTPGEYGDDTQLFDVHIIAETTGIVSSRNGLRIQPDFSIENHPPLDIVLVPGGRGTRRERTNPQVLGWLERQDRQVQLMTSVCTGALLLAANGLLDGKSATTHWASIEWLREHHPAVTVRDDARFVDEGHVVTSAGVSAGIDMALHIVDRLHGSEVARQTARHMEYNWNPWSLPPSPSGSR